MASPRDRQMSELSDPLSRTNQSRGSDPNAATNAALLEEVRRLRKHQDGKSFSTSVRAVLIVLSIPVIVVAILLIIGVVQSIMAR